MRGLNMKRLSLGMVAIIVILTIIITLLVDSALDKRRAEKELAQTPMIEDPIDPNVEPEDEPVAPAEPETNTEAQANGLEPEETIETEAGTIVANRTPNVNSQGIIVGNLSDGPMNCTISKEVRDSKKCKNVPGIICWGDSLTEGLGGDGDSFPNTMQYLFNINGIKMDVVNYGASGDDSNAICGKAGGYGLYTTETFNMNSDLIPAHVGYVANRFSQRMDMNRHVDTGLNPVTILGIEGYLTNDNMNHSADSYFSFARSEAGGSFDVPAGTQIIPYGATHYLDYAQIIFIGGNHGFIDLNDVASQQNAIINTREKNNNVFIVVGLTIDGIVSFPEYDKFMEEQYGDKYFNFREYCANTDLSKYGVTLTDEDKYLISMGGIPSSIKSDENHLNSKGYQILGQALYDKFVELYM